MTNQSVMIATSRERRKAPTIVLQIVMLLPIGVDAIIPPYPTDVIVMIVNHSVLDIDSKL